VLFQAKNASAHTILCKLGLDYIFGNVGPFEREDEHRWTEELTPAVKKNTICRVDHVDC